MAKTKAIKTLASAIKAKYNRIQFTPDLLPSDITGSEIYVASEGKFEFRKGPVFANLILADEINRAPAKVQSALLEAMAERQVSHWWAALRFAQAVYGDGDAKPDRARRNL